jgi:hypothetical protein
LIHNKIPEQFPKLKFGFIEASAGWVPFMMHIIKRLFREKWKFSSDKDMFSAYRISLPAKRMKTSNTFPNNGEIT